MTQRRHVAREGAEKVMPYDASRQKGEQVEQMFDSIAPAYDFMNTAMTFGLHNVWRRIAMQSLGKRLPEGVASPRILDIATGTGDIVFDLLRRFPGSRITGADLSAGMLAVARRKLASAPPEWHSRVSFEQADCLHLPYPDSSFDAVTVGYGVRNFQRLEEGYREMARVLRPGGTVCVIELSCPVRQPMRSLYDIYATRLIPAIGRLVSGDSRAYSYLPESIAAAPQRDAMTELMLRAGFSDAEWRSLTFGVVTLYFASVAR